MTETPIRCLCVSFHPDRPDAEMYMGLAETGFDLRVTCAANAPNFRRLSSSKATVIPFEITRRIDAGAIAYLKREIEAFKPHILHLFDNKPVLNGLMAARGADVKVVVYRGNVGNISVLNPSSWLRYLNPRIDRIVCVSDAVRQYLEGLHCLGWRIPPRKLVTIYKGHDLLWYAGEPISRDSLGIPSGAFVVGCVANWRPRKGVETLIRACGYLPRDAPIHVVLVGNGLNNATLAKAIARSPFRDQIHVLGHRMDAAAVAGAFDVAVLPALRREGLPKTVIEAMAYGVATVATRVGGVPEVIEDGVSGLIVPPGDARDLGAAIGRLYTSPHLRAALGIQARERIKTKFRIEDTIAKTAALYRDLVG